MKVLVLPSFYPTNDDLSRGIFFQEQGNLCVSKDTVIDVLYCERRSLKKIINPASWVNHFQVSEKYEKNVFVFRRHSWNLLPTKIRMGQKLWVYFTLSLFEKYLQKRGKPDVIHVQSTFFAGEVANIIYQKYKIPFIVQEHSTLVASQKLNASQKAYFKQIFLNAKHIVTVSNPLKKLLAGKFDIEEQSVKVVPNFIDTDFFSSDSVIASLKVKPPGFLFLAVSFLTAKKRIDRLLIAFEKSFKGNPDVFLYIGGEGEERNNIESLIRQLGIESRVKLLGRLNRLEVREYMNMCDAFVLASDIETFGVVLIEAMAMGKPVVATRSGGPEDIVPDTVGILADPDTDDIANALVKMHKEIAKYDHALIKQHVIDNFSMNSTVRQLRHLYEAI